MCRTNDCRATFCAECLRASASTGSRSLLRDQFAEGKKAGAAEVTNAVQDETLNTLRKAQEPKGQVDDEVSKTPYKDTVDRLD